MSHRHHALTRFGSNVRRRREAAGLSQESLAEKAELDRTCISGIERGTRKPTILSAAVRWFNIAQSPSEYFVTVESQELWFWRKRLVRDQKGLAFEVFETVMKGIVSDSATKFFADHETKIFVECNQSPIESCVMDSGQAEAVLRIQPLVWMRTPRQNVTRNEQLANRDAGNAAATIKSIQHHLPKELLSSPDCYFIARFSRTCRCRRHSHAPNSDALHQLHLVHFFSVEEPAKHIFAYWCQRVAICLKLGPDLTIKVDRARQSFSSARSNRRIEGCEVRQFHRKTAGRPFHPLSDVLDYRLSLVEKTERDFLVDIQRDEQFITGPASAIGHLDRVARTGQKRKLVRAADPVEEAQLIRE
jgi:DNA-binding XRE family transcriptional regulator